MRVASGGSVRLGRARSRPGDAWKWAGVGERLGQRAGLAWEKSLGWVLGFGLLWVWVFYFYFSLSSSNSNKAI